MSFSESRRRVITGIAGLAASALFSHNSSIADVVSELDSDESALIKNAKLVFKNNNGQRKLKNFKEANFDAYAPIVLESAIKFRNIARIPLGIYLSWVYQESQFDPLAVSPMRALGIMQVIRKTAVEDINVQVYPEKDFPDLLKQENDFKNRWREAGKLYGDSVRLHAKNNFNGAKAKKLEYDKAIKEFYVVFTGYKKTIRQRVDEFSSAGKVFDARFVPSMIIPAGVEHLARMIADAKRELSHWPGSHTDLGLVGYNYGYKRMKDARQVPNVAEPRNYVFDIHNLTNLIYSR